MNYIFCHVLRKNVLKTLVNNLFFFTIENKKNNEKQKKKTSTPYKNKGFLTKNAHSIRNERFCYSEPERIRTFDRLLRREVLYPAELLAHLT